MSSARLLITCSDRRGIVAATAGFLTQIGANIVASDQHSTDPEGGRFFMRMEFTLDRVELGPAELEERFQDEVAGPFGMAWRIAYSGSKNLAILVSRYDHCLLDLLWRQRRGELDATIGVVISNHPDLREDTEAFGVPYVHVPMSRELRAQAEDEMLDHLRGRYDLVVLARYMQILSGRFLDALETPVINIHHSFLPAFAGADPYHRAHERGVKIIGATAHYVTEELDAGPIIEQDVAHVSHRDSVDDLVQIGRDIERAVLARAVRSHLEDRVLVHENKTVVF